MSSKVRGPVRTRDVASEPARKTLLATFNGDHFVAEREGDQLCIYAIGTDEIGGVVRDGVMPAGIFAMAAGSER